MVGKAVGAAVCTGGPADWKSSKSSSSSVANARGVALGAEMGLGSSKEKRSTSGSFFGGSGFFAARSSGFRRLEEDEVLVGLDATAPSSYSSYSSNLSCLPAAELLAGSAWFPYSWKSLVWPPNPPPSPYTPPLNPPYPPPAAPDDSPPNPPYLPPPDNPPLKPAPPSTPEYLFLVVRAFFRSVRI